MGLEVALLGFVLGIIFVLTVAYLLLLNPFGRIEKPPFNDQFIPARIPFELKQLLTSPDEELLKKSESCIGLNFIIHFLYQEYKDTRWFRRWALKKLQMEFNDLTSRTAAGRLVQDIKIRDLTLGTQFPVIKTIKTDNIKLADDKESFQELDLLLDVEYRGGFMMSVDVTALLGRCAFVSIKVHKVAGQARLRLTRVPYTHWSFAFVDMPLMDFKVDSNFQGRPLKQLVPLIVQQFRRAVQRKHVLPRFKMRYRPLFSNPLLEPSCPINDFGHIALHGALEATVLSCSRLNTSCAPLSYNLVYCVLSLDKSPYGQCQTTSLHYVSMGLKLSRHASSQPIGLTLSRQPRPDLSQSVQVITVEAASQAEKVGFRPADTILAVNNIAVNSDRHAYRLINSAIGEITVLIERNLANVEDVDDVTEKLASAMNISCRENDEDEEDFVHVVYSSNRSNGSTRQYGSNKNNNKKGSPHLRRSSSETALAPRTPLIPPSDYDYDYDDDILLKNQSPLIIDLDPCPATATTRQFDMRRCKSSALLLEENCEIKRNNSQMTTDEAANIQDSKSVGGLSLDECHRLKVAELTAKECEMENKDLKREGSSSSRRQRITAKASEVAQQKWQTGKATVRELWNRHRKEQQQPVLSASSSGLAVDLAVEALAESVSTDDIRSLVDSNATNEASTMAGRIYKQMKKDDKIRERPSSVHLPATSESNQRCDDVIDEDVLARQRTTKAVQLTENVLWGQSVHFTLQKETCRYLSIAVWAKPSSSYSSFGGKPMTALIPNDSQQTLTSAAPLLLGYTSVFVPEIIADCSSTLSNCHRQTFTLRPPPGQPNIPSVYQKFASHPGFDERLCYGDVTVGFRYFSDGLPETQSPAEGAASGTETATESFSADVQISEREEKIAAAFEVDSQQKRHSWANVHLRQGLVCALCHGKIWLKSASQCGRCAIICHIKCNAKADTSIACVSREGLLHDDEFEEVDMVDRANLLDKPIEIRIDSASVSDNQELGSEEEQPRRRRIFKVTDKLVSSWRRKSAALSSADVPKACDEPDLAVISDLAIDDTVSFKNSMNDLTEFLDDSPEFKTMLYGAGGSYNEKIIGAAKDLGQHLFADMNLLPRKKKINDQIEKIQAQINDTANERMEVGKELKMSSMGGEREGADARFRGLDQRLQALAVLMLHYCAGLQNCIEKMEKTEESISNGAEDQPLLAESADDSERKNSLQDDLVVAKDNSDNGNKTEQGTVTHDNLEFNL